MRKKLLCLGLLLITVAAFSSCKRTCRCYTYYGTVVDFDVDELSAQGYSCVQMEQIDYGLVYSICEKVY